VKGDRKVGRDEWQAFADDGRSRHGRRYHDLCADLACDLGGDLSTTETAVVRQAAALMEYWRSSVLSAPPIA
jgi:hypothetical protein